MLQWIGRNLRTTVTFCRTYASQTGNQEFDYAAAREWYKSFHPLCDIGEVTYARSSGPGGQNVNKYAA